MMERPPSAYSLPQSIRSKIPPASNAAPQEGGTKILVTFEAGEKSNPQNSHPAYKIWLTAQMSLLALAGALGSSILSSASAEIAEDVGVKSEVTSLTVALFVLGMLLLLISLALKTLASPSIRFPNFDPMKNVGDLIIIIRLGIRSLTLGAYQ